MERKPFFSQSCFEIHGEPFLFFEVPEGAKAASTRQHIQEIENIVAGKGSDSYMLFEGIDGPAQIFLHEVIHFYEDGEVGVTEVKNHVDVPLPTASEIAPPEDLSEPVYESMNINYHEEGEAWDGYERHLSFAQYLSKLAFIPTLMVRHKKHYMNGYVDVEEYVLYPKEYEKTKKDFVDFLYKKGCKILADEIKNSKKEYVFVINDRYRYTFFEKAKAKPLPMSVIWLWVSNAKM